MRSLMITFLLAIAAALSAQSDQGPVTWSFDFQDLEDGTVKVTATAEIAPDWCIYSPYTESGGPIPTSFVLDDGHQAVGDPSEESEVINEVDALFGIEVKKMKKHAVLSQIVAVASGATTVHGGIRFMACDKTKCLPPTVVEFSHQL